MATKQGVSKRVLAGVLAFLVPAVLVGCGVHRGQQPQVAKNSAIPGPPYSVAVPVPPPAPAPPAPPPAVVSTIHSLARNFDGKVGIAVKSIDDGWSVNANGNMLVPQQSVSKLWVAMTVLDARDQGKLSLDDPLTITKADLTLFHQPVAALVLKNGSYTATVGEIMHRALTMSDNTCNDKLLWLVGGPPAVRAFLAKRGIAPIRFGPGERLFQSKTAGLTWQPSYSIGRAFYQARAKLPDSVRRAAFNDYVADPPDGAAPNAVVDALARLKKGELLSAASTSWLITTLQESKTGKNRLHSAVPSDWTFAHKTGTGQDFDGKTAGYNDVAIITSPDGHSYAVAVMIAETARTIPQRWDLMHAVIATIVANSP